MVRGRTVKAWVVTLALVLLAIASAGCGESESASRGRPYADMLKRHGSKVGTALQNVGCKEGVAPAECSAGYKAALDEVTAFRKDLDSTPPPDCLKKYDGNIRDGLTALSSGLEKIIQGIEANDAAPITAGTEEVKAGGQQMKASEKSAEEASC